MKKWLKNGIALVLGLFLALGLAEGVLRLFPTAYTKFNSTLQYSFNPKIGYTLKPGQRSRFALSCFSVDNIRVNSHGFRDEEWLGGNRFKIGILGDSFMEGLQVKNEEIAAAQLEKWTGYEVLNTGLSGFGTMGQLVVWQEYLKAYRPDVLLLFYYPPNDLINNHCKLNDSTFNAFFAPCPCGILTNQGPKIRRDFQDTIPEAGWFWQNSMTFRATKSILYSGPGGKAARSWEAYLSPYSGEWAEAQQLTEFALRSLRDSAAVVGTELFVVTVPSWLSMLPDTSNWQTEVMHAADWEKIPANFDRETPNLVIRELCDSLKVPMLELEPQFRQFRDAQNLEEPGFFFSCNGHWNATGHALAANLTAEWLIVTGRVPLESPGDSLKTLSDLRQGRKNGQPAFP